MSSKGGTIRSQRRNREALFCTFFDDISVDVFLLGLYNYVGRNRSFFGEFLANDASIREIHKYPTTIHVVECGDARR